MYLCMMMSSYTSLYSIKGYTSSLLKLWEKCCFSSRGGASGPYAWLGTAQVSIWPTRRIITSHAHLPHTWYLMWHQMWGKYKCGYKGIIRSLNPDWCCWNTLSLSLCQSADWCWNHTFKEGRYNCPWVGQPLQQDTPHWTMTGVNRLTSLRHCVIDRGWPCLHVKAGQWQAGDRGI